MNELNKKYLQDNYSLKEQAEAGTLVLTEEQKREFYKIYNEEVDPTGIVNLYSQEALNEMVKEVFSKYEQQPKAEPVEETFIEKILPKKKEKLQRSNSDA